MILRITQATVVGPCHLDVSFNDGTSGRIDVSPLLEGPVFEPLKKAEFFAQAVLDPVCGTVVWPNNADFAPEALKELIDLASSTPTIPSKA